MLTTYSLSGLTVVTPDTATAGTSIQVDQKKLGRLGGKCKFEVRFGDGFAAFPALINIHDHFNGNYLPKVGPGPGEFYVKWLDWEKDLRNSDVVKVERAKTSGRWEAAYAGPASIAVPDDLAAALHADPQAQAAFDRLTRLNRYAVLYRVGTARRPETRARRIMQFVAMLAAGETIYPQRRSLDDE